MNKITGAKQEAVDHRLGQMAAYFSTGAQR
jgi:hypothetical protein